MSRAKLGQHWLIDKRICARIADAIELTKDVTCIEIGGGKGALTRIIAPLCKRLIVYEIDSNWAEHLREYGPSWGGQLTVRELDALKIEWNRDMLELAQDEPLAITGNLPYYLTSPLLLRLAYSGLDIRSGIFLIQKEVAERIAAKPGDSNYSRLTVSLGAFLESKILFTVPPEAFKPRPKVMSTMIKMTPHGKPLIDKELIDLFEHTVQIAFHMRRKTLKNNLLMGFPELSGANIEEIIHSMGIKPNARAQEISVQDFIALTAILNLHGAVTSHRQER